MGYMSDKFKDLCKAYDLEPLIHHEHMDRKVYEFKDGFNSSRFTLGENHTEVSVVKTDSLNAIRCMHEFSIFCHTLHELDRIDAINKKEER